MRGVEHANLVLPNPLPTGIFGYLSSDAEQRESPAVAGDSRGADARIRTGDPFITSESDLSPVVLCRALQTGTLCLRRPGGDWLGQSNAAHIRPTKPGLCGGPALYLFAFFGDVHDVTGYLRDRLRTPRRSLPA